MPIKLYLSQANQGHNAGPLSYTEKAGLDAIIHAVINREFSEDARFNVKHTVAGDRIDTAKANCLEANAWGADWYVALHSNAGGAGARGTFGFYNSKASNGYGMAKAIVAAVSPLSPGVSSALIEKPGFIEIHTPHAPACLIELEAHDWKIGVEWLTGKRPQIARALYVGICRGMDLVPKPVDTSVDYRPLKVAAVKVAAALDMPHPGVDVTANVKGPSFEKLLRSIANR